MLALLGISRPLLPLSSLLSFPLPHLAQHPPSCSSSSSQNTSQLWACAPAVPPARKALPADVAVTHFLISFKLLPKHHFLRATIPDSPPSLSNSLPCFSSLQNTITLTKPLIQLFVDCFPSRLEAHSSRVPVCLGQFISK